MSKPLVTILYGSQTGNAEDMSKRIGCQAKNLGLNVIVEAMDDFALKILPKQNLVLFVCSTTGHGQEPENMKNLYNFIRRRDLPNDCLSDLRFAVYGLGDSSYSKFNYVSKILFKRLEMCGAKPIHGLVTGDEQHPYGCDGFIYPKLDELWSNLGIHSNRESSESPNPVSSYDAKFLPDDSAETKSIFRETFVTRYNIQTGICTTNQRLTPDSHFQDTRFLCFKTRDNIEYQPGDVCSILPANPDDNVNQFIEILNLNPESRFNLIKKDPNYMINYLYDFIPDGLSIKSLVKYYLDIQSVPRRSFFEFLWPFSDNELEQNKLKEFASTEGQEEMYEYCVQPKRSILEVLLDFPHTVKNIKFEYLFDLIPPIKARSFSIASSSLAHPNELHLIVGVVKYQTRMRRTRKGLCSNYLAQLKPVDRFEHSSPASELKFFVKRTLFKMPQKSDVPMILVGPGLGIAPFRSFIEERSLKQKGAVPNIHLYYGCRFTDADFYFRSELERYASDKLIRLRVAFSREESKQYVQDLMVEDSKMINRLVANEKAVIYVAGNSKLPEDLRRLLAKILMIEDGDTDRSNEAEKLVATLEAQNRIQYDCW